MVPPPLTKAELLDRCDVAGEARVLSRNGARAEIQFERFFKGWPRQTNRFGMGGLSLRTMVALRTWPESPMPGQWWDEDCFVPGNVILTHLAWNAETSCYESIWWNATSVETWAKGAEPPSR